MKTHVLVTIVTLIIFHIFLHVSSRKSSTLQEINPCPYNYTGPIKNPEDCYSFYLCNAGIPELMECPARLCYNPENEMCDHCDLVPGCETGTPPTVTPTSHPNSSSTLQPTTSPSTPSPTTTSSTESSTMPELPCPDSPFIKMPYPGDCTKFYFCINGVNEGVSTCEDGLWFHFQKQQCIIPWDDICS